MERRIWAVNICHCCTSHWTPGNTAGCSQQWAPQATRVMWNKDKGSRSLSHMQRKLPEGRRNSILKSTWKKGIRQLPRGQWAVSCWCPKTCTTSATCSYPGVSHWDPPHCPHYCPSAEHVLSSTNHRDTFGCCWQGHKRVTSAHATLENWAAAGRALQGAVESLNHSARSISAHILPFHFTW